MQHDVQAVVSNLANKTKKSTQKNTLQYRFCNHWIALACEGDLKSIMLTLYNMRSTLRCITLLYSIRFLQLKSWSRMFWWLSSSVRLWIPCLCFPLPATPALGWRTIAFTAGLLLCHTSSLSWLGSTTSPTSALTVWLAAWRSSLRCLRQNKCKSI